MKNIQLAAILLPTTFWIIYFFLGQFILNEKKLQHKYTLKTIEEISLKTQFETDTFYYYPLSGNALSINTILYK